jgi:hypothetical protein
MKKTFLLAATLIFAASNAFGMGFCMGGWYPPAGPSDGQMLSWSSATNAVVWTTGTGTGDLLAANNLSDVANLATAQANLHIDSILTALGLADDATHFGVFTGETIVDNQTAKAAMQALETAVETKGDGDITSVLGDLVGAVPVIFQTWTAFGAGDATPSVSAASFYRTVDTTTITDFDDPVEGQMLIVYCGAATVFDLTASGLVAANRAADYTCVVGDPIIWFYRDTQWYASNIPDEITTISDPNADRIYFWDDSETATGLLTAGLGLDITAPNLTVGSLPIVTTSKAAAYTIGTDSATESYGGTVYVTSAATITAPAVATRMSFSVITVGAIAVSLDTNASDRIYLDGVLLDDGDKATNTSLAGDMITCQYYSADGWWCMSGTVAGAHWTDGGP